MLLEALAVVDTCVMHSAAALSPVKSSTVLAKARPHNDFGCNLVGVATWPLYGGYFQLNKSVGERTFGRYTE